MRSFIFLLSFSALFIQPIYSDIKSKELKENTKNIKIKDIKLKILNGPQNGAAYLSIYNSNKYSVILYKVEVDPDVFDRVELHDHIERKDGNGLKFMEMLEIPQMEIDAGGTLFLRCGGKHLMLIGIKKTLCQFEKLKFIFHFRVGAKEFTKAIEIDFKKSLLDPKNKRCEAE